MIGQRFPILDWPYKEGLRIDEAMHNLTILVTGLYGKKLPNQILLKFLRNVTLQLEPKTF